MRRPRILRGSPKPPRSNLVASVKTYTDSGRDADNAKTERIAKIVLKFIKRFEGVGWT